MTQVVTQIGRVQGFVDPTGVHTFLGVPYAAPPRRSGRFRAPQPVEPWVGTHDGTRPGPACPQAGPPRGATVDEDCLNLSIWTPSVGGSLPVLFYIPGGGFVSGSASSPVTDGAALARSGIVVVAVNYRLHAFGFLDVEESDGPNVGLADQITALEWVQTHIGSFGGDRAAVTIAGYSAGANSVGALLAVSRARECFHRAVLHDGSAVLNLTSEASTRVGEAFMSRIGTGTDRRGVLETLESQRVLDIAMDVAKGNGLFPSPSHVMADRDRRKGLTWAPGLVGELRTPPVEKVAQGAASSIELLIGTNRDSMALVTDSIDVDVDLIRRYLGDHVDAEFTTETILQVYEDELPSAEPGDRLGAILTDLLLAVPCVQLLEAQITHNPNVWLYEFGQPSARTGKASHGIDTGLWFGNPGSTGDPTLATALASSLVSFVTQGHPGSPFLPDWPRYDLETRPVLFIDSVSRIEADPHRIRRELWAGRDLP